MSEQCVVTQVRLEGAGDGWRLGEPGHRPLGERQGLLRHVSPVDLVEHPGDQRHVCGVEDNLLLQCGGRLPGQQPGSQFTQRAAHLHLSLIHHRQPFGRTAPFTRAAVGPEAAVRDAEGLDHGNVEPAAFRAQEPGEPGQPGHDLLPRLARGGLLTQVSDHLLGFGAPAPAARDQAVGQLPGRGLPVVLARRNTEPCPSAEPATAASVVQGDQDDAVLRAVSQQIRQRVGQLTRGTQGDLMVASVGVVRHAPDVLADDGFATPVACAEKFAPFVPVSPADVAVLVGSGRFAVIRHAQTISRITSFRFDLWISPIRDTPTSTAEVDGPARTYAVPSGPGPGCQCRPVVWDV